MPETSAPSAPLVACSVDPRSNAITLHHIDLDGSSPLGTFATAAEAWRALDALDAPIR
jgi:hypothetical protein